MARTLPIGLESKGGPDRDEVHRLSRWRLLEKVPREEVGIVNSRHEVPTDGPGDERIHLVSNIAVVAPVAGTDGIDRGSVEAVRRTLAPEEHPVGAKNQVRPEMEVQRRVEVDDIGRSDETRLRGIRRKGEERVKRPEVGM